MEYLFEQKILMYQLRMIFAHTLGESCARAATISPLGLGQEQTQQNYIIINKIL
jgi:hypothetical protein